MTISSFTKSTLKSPHSWFSSELFWKRYKNLIIANTFYSPVDGQSWWDFWALPTWKQTIANFIWSDLLLLYWWWQLRSASGASIMRFIPRPNVRSGGHLDFCVTSALGCWQPMSISARRLSCWIEILENPGPSWITPEACQSDIRSVFWYSECCEVWWHHLGPFSSKYRG